MFIYALIARGSLVLAEYTSQDGDYASIARKILIKSHPNYDKITFTKDEFAFTLFSCGDYTFLCISKTHSSRETAHNFLDELAKEFFLIQNKKDMNSTQSWSAQSTKIIKKLLVFIKLLLG